MRPKARSSASSTATIEAGRAVVAEINKAGGKAVFAAADVADQAEVNAAVANVTSAIGPANVLFNHAGTIIIKPFLETTLEEWEWLMAINVTQHVPDDQGRSAGNARDGRRLDRLHVVDLGDRRDAARDRLQYVEGRLPYVRAIDRRRVSRPRHSLQRRLPGFRERRPHGLREVAELTKLGVDASEAALAVQQGRLCEPEEVARAALFLASDEASFVNGAHLFVDNCFTAV